MPAPACHPKPRASAWRCGATCAGVGRPRPHGRLPPEEWRPPRWPQQRGCPFARWFGGAGPWHPSHGVLRHVLQRVQADLCIPPSEHPDQVRSWLDLLSSCRSTVYWARSCGHPVQPHKSEGGSSIQMLAQDTRAESKSMTLRQKSDQALQCPKAIMVELEYSFLSSFTCWRAI
ncbi:unnamed protein product [Urochloa humidicola]